SGPGRSVAEPAPRKSANRVPHWHRPASSGAPDRESPWNKASMPAPRGTSRYRADSLDRSVERRPWPDSARRRTTSGRARPRDTGFEVDPSGVQALAVHYLKSLLAALTRTRL